MLEQDDKLLKTYSILEESHLSKIDEEIRAEDPIQYILWESGDVRLPPELILETYKSLVIANE